MVAERNGVSMTKEMRRAIENLIEDLELAHEDELSHGHHGDAEHDGLAPECCSFCLHIDEARVLLEVSAGV
jgi:hypothetical protein